MTTCANGTYFLFSTCNSTKQVNSELVSKVQKYNWLRELTWILHKLIQKKHGSGKSIQMNTCTLRNESDSGHFSANENPSCWQHTGQSVAEFDHAFDSCAGVLRSSFMRWLIMRFMTRYLYCSWAMASPSSRSSTTKKFFSSGVLKAFHWKQSEMDLIHLC